LTLRFLGVLGIVLLAVTGCAPRTPPNAGQPTIQGQSMQRMLANIETVRAYVRRNATKQEAERAADELISWSARMGELFPPAVAPQQYVDMTPEMARDAPRAMTSHATALSLAVRTAPIPAVSEQLERTERDGCGFCHRRPYRMPER